MNIIKYTKTLSYRIAVLFMVIFLSSSLSAEKKMWNIIRSLPDSTDGWILREDQYYNRKTLYDYIDGGAELYLSYGFRGVISRVYQRKNQPEIIVDIFDMGSPENAFGVFSHFRETIENDFGQGSQYIVGSLQFWIGCYFISILASPETKESREVVFQLARIIEQQIDEEGSLPKILHCLPRDSLIATSVRYFKHYIWLNSYYFIADQNILHIDENTEAVLAKYQEKGHQAILLLLKYRSASKAEKAYQDFIQYHLPKLASDPVLQMEDGSWTGCQLEQDIIKIVLNSHSKAHVLKLLNDVKNVR